MVPWVVEHLDPFALRDILIVCIWGFFYLTVVSFVGLVVHKIVVERRESRLASLKNRYLSSYERKFLDPAHDLDAPGSALEFEAMADTGTHLLSESGHSDSERDRRFQVRDWIRQLGVPAFLEDRVRRGRGWIDRFVALEKLGFLSLPEEGVFFQKLMEKEPEELLRAKAVWALSRVARPEDLTAINAALSHPSFMSAKFSEFIFTNVIEAFRERGASLELVRLFEGMRKDRGLPVLLLRDVVEACGFCRFEEGRPFVLAFYAEQAERPEVKMACLRALGQMGAGGSEGALFFGLADPDPRVRAVAARSAGEAGAVSAITALDRQLGDENYHVRLNAAISLGKLGQAGRNILMSRTEDPDRFVREACRYMLEETSRV